MRPELLRHRHRKEVPDNAVVARHGIEVCQGRLLGGTVGYKAHERIADVLIVGERAQSPVACARNGLDLALGGILKEVLLRDAGHEGGEVIGGAESHAQTRNDAGLAQEPLLSGYCSAIGGIRRHGLRTHPRCSKAAG